MPTPKLLNRLRKHRRVCGLSQQEIAFLLGCKSGAKVCRYERMARQPPLKTALAYEVIFNTPVSELFKGEFQKVERAVAGRATLLARKLAATRRLDERRLRVLAAISLGASAQANHASR